MRVMLNLGQLEVAYTYHNMAIICFKACSPTMWTNMAILMYKENYVMRYCRAVPT